MIQLNNFDDGITRIRPTIVFRGEGKHIKASGKGSRGKRVKIYFRKKAWCGKPEGMDM